MSLEEEPRIDRVGAVYRVFGDLEVAIEVALATDRPLLLSGDSGSGKSSVAMWAAREYGWRYYEHVITARTQPQELLWSFDSIRRLSDATASDTDLDPEKYIRPGALWWAFDRGKAKKLKAASEPDRKWNEDHAERPAVVLIDEIDKADPDLPNSLLVPLGNRYFTVDDLAQDNVVHETSDKGSLIIITTNGERELPQPFIRRCAVYTLQDHQDDELEEIATSHYSDLRDTNGSHMIRLLVKELRDQQKIARSENRRPPSTAEFLDAVKACRDHGYHTKKERLKKVLDMLYVKQPVRAGSAPDGRRE